MRMIRISGAALLLVLSACVTPPEVRRRSEPMELRIPFGISLEGRPIEARVFGTGPDTVLFLATIHGNEPSGTPLLLRLAERLQSEPGLCRKRRVILVPVANPDGLAHSTRTNSRGVDLNRNFPASNRVDSRQTGTALSEPESAALVRLIKLYPPERTVSLHQPRSCVDYDGPAEGLARAMSGSCGLPVTRLGSLPGSLGSYLGMDLGKPIITLELPPEGSGANPDLLWRRYGPALLAFALEEPPGGALSAETPPSRR